MRSLIAFFSFAAIVTAIPGCDRDPANQKYFHLHEAAMVGDVSKLRARLKEGDDVNELRDGMTPLYSASTKAAAQLLIDAGANVNAKTTTTEPAVLFVATTDVTPLCVTSSSEVATVLIDHGASVNDVDSKGRQPMHYQAGLGHVEVLKLLLAKGGKVDARSDDEMTPLMIAAAYGKRDAAKLLMEAGADVNRQDARGWTPLFHAARLGSWNCMRDLLEKGAHPAVRNHEGDDILAHIRKGPMYRSSGDGPFPKELEELLRQRGESQ